MTRSSLHALLGFFAFGRQREAVIEPGEAAEHVLFGPWRGGRVAHVARNSFGVVERPKRTGFKLHPRGAQQARGFVAPEGGGEVALRLVYHLSERDRVLDRHAGALRERL